MREFAIYIPGFLIENQELIIENNCEAFFSLGHTSYVVFHIHRNQNCVIYTYNIKFLGSAFETSYMV